MDSSTKEKLEKYHPPACGDGYKQYSKERNCEFLTDKPCDGCMFNLNRFKIKLS